MFNLAKKVGLTGLASVLCLVVLEVAFRIAGYKALYDVYSKPEIFWRHDPLLGWSMEPGTSGEYVGPRPFPVEFRSHVRINSWGLRGPELVDLPPSGFRVLVLGDSVVAGFEVEEDRTFEALLEKQLTAEMSVPIQVINGGVRGYGTDQSYLFYRERGRALHPDLVVFNTGYNDPEDNTTLHRARRPFGKAAFSIGSDGSLTVVGSPIPDYPFCSGYRLNAEYVPVRIDGPRERLMCWIQTALSDHSALFTFATLRIQPNTALVYKLFGLGTPSDQTTIMSDATPKGSVTPAGRLTTSLITQMAAIAHQDGARFLLSSCAPDLSLLDQQQIKDDHIEIFDRDQIWIDSTILTFKADSHFNELGHARLAEYLAPVVLRTLRAIAAARGDHAADGTRESPSSLASKPVRL